MELQKGKIRWLFTFLKSVTLYYKYKNININIQSDQFCDEKEKENGNLGVCSGVIEFLVLPFHGPTSTFKQYQYGVMYLAAPVIPVFRVREVSGTVTFEKKIFF